MASQKPQPTSDNQITLPLLGVPLTISSQHPVLMAAAEVALARWRDLPPALCDLGPPAHLELVVRSPNEAALPRSKLVIARHGPEWLAAGEGLLLRADLASGHGLAFVEARLLSDAWHLQQAVIERMGLLLVSQRARIALTAAAVLGRQQAVVLVASPAVPDLAPLLHACQRQGLALLAASTIYVGPQPAPLLWGHAPMRDADHSTARIATHARNASICLVTTGHGQASRLVPCEASAVITKLVASNPDADPLTVQQAATWLAAGGVQQLEWGADAERAAALLAWRAGGRLG